MVLMAQVSNLPTVLNIKADKYDKAVYEPFGVVPTSLSYDGDNRIYIRTEDEQVAIYSNAFTPVKQFKISATYEGEKQKELSRTVTVTVTGGELIKENLVVDFFGGKNLLELYLNCKENNCETTYNVPENWNEDDVKNYLETNDHVWGEIDEITSVQPYQDGGTIFIWDMEAFDADGSENLNYWEASKYGKKYPRTFYLWQDGFLYYCSGSYYRDESEYSKKEASFSYGEWEEGKELSSATEVQNYGVGFINYDNDQLVLDTEDGDGLCLTQTLFNDDEQYEYLYFPISSYVVSYSGNQPANPVCLDCYSESTTFIEKSSVYYRSAYAGFEVMSENGSSLQSVSFPNGFLMKGYVRAQIVRLSGEYYIVCTGEMNDQPAMLVYKINRNDTGASIRQVSAPMQIAVYPCPANRSQTITVNLNGDTKNDTELQVVNMNGQVIDRRMIPAGQQQATLPVSHFAPGTNLINATQNGQLVGTTRVIVR